MDGIIITEGELSQADEERIVANPDDAGVLEGKFLSSHDARLIERLQKGLWGSHWPPEEEAQDEPDDLPPSGVAVKPPPLLVEQVEKL